MQNLVSRTAVMVAGDVVSCKSKQQTTLAKSFKKTEFTILGMCVIKAFWFKNTAPMLETVFDREQSSKILKIFISEGNQECITDAQNANLSGLSKLIDMKYQFSVDLV